MERTRDLYSEKRKSGGSYKIDCKGIKPDEDLRITITHSGIPHFKKKYIVSGSKLIGKDSISFKIIQTGQDIHISWQGSILPKIDLSV